MKFIKEDPKEETKYGSIEYNFEKIVEALNNSLNWVNEFKKISNIKPAMIIEDLGKVIGSLQSSSSLYSYNFNSYFNPSSRYTEFNKDDEKHIENCYNFAKLDLETRYNKMVETHNKNLLAIQNNKEIREAIIKFMDLVGIKQYSSFDYKTSRARYRTETKHNPNYLADFDKFLPISDCFESLERDYKTTLTNLETWKKDNLFRIEQQKAKKKADEEQLRKIGMAFQIAKDNNLEYENNEDMIEKANDFARIQWIKNNPNEDCRIVLGNMFDGFYFEED